MSYQINLIDIILFHGAIAPSLQGPPHSRGFVDHRQRRTRFGRTPLDEVSACRKDLYLTTRLKLTTDKHTFHRRGSNPQSQ